MNDFGAGNPKEITSGGDSNLEKCSHLAAPDPRGVLAWDQTLKTLLTYRTKRRMETNKTGKTMETYTTPA